MTVEENLLVGGHLLERSQLPARIKAIKEIFPILQERKKQDARTLSGGEQQMLAIGMALMPNPCLLILDEPTLGLAPILVEEIGKHIVNIKESGVAILLVEENVDIVSEVADNICVFATGTSVFSGTFSQLVGNFDLAKTYLGM